MKILAKAYEGYILSVAEGELANILGYSSIYSDGYKRSDIEGAIKYSTPIQVSKIFSDYERIRDYKRNSTIKEASEKLNRVTELLKPIDEIVKLLPTLENKE